MADDTLSPFEEDAELLRQVVDEREKDALDTLVERHSRLVMTVARQMLSGRNDLLEEAFQGTFLRLVERAHTIRDRRALAAWLFTVAQNECRRLLARSRRIPVPASPEILEQSVMTRVQTENHDDLQTLLDEVDNLPEKFQPSIILCCLEGKSREEAAQQLGLTIDAIKGRLERGRKLLKKRLLAKGVGLTILLSAWQTQQAASAGLISGTLLQSTVQSCVCSALWTSGGTAVTTTTLSKGASLMAIGSGKKVLVGTVLAVLTLGGGATYLLNSGQDDIQIETAPVVPPEPVEIVAESDPAEPEIDRTISSEVLQLISEIQQEEERYRNIEVEMTWETTSHSKWADPLPGFDVSPDRPTMDVKDHPIMDDASNYSVHMKSRDGTERQVAQGNKYMMMNKSKSILSLLFQRRGTASPESQEYVSSQHSQEVRFDGETLYRQNDDREEQQIRLPVDEHGMYLPHVLCTTNGVFCRRLSTDLIMKPVTDNERAYREPRSARNIRLISRTVGDEPMSVLDYELYYPGSTSGEYQKVLSRINESKNFIPEAVTIERYFGVSTFGPAKVNSSEDIKLRSKKEFIVQEWQEVQPGIWYPALIQKKEYGLDEISGELVQTTTTEYRYRVISLSADYPVQFFRQSEE